MFCNNFKRNLGDLEAVLCGTGLVSSFVYLINELFQVIFILFLSFHKPQCLVLTIKLRSNKEYKIICMEILM